MPESRLTRIQINVKANYMLKGNQGECNIVDISSGGIGLSVKQILVVDDLIHVSFKIPTADNEEIDFWGIVKNVNSNFVGLKYEEISNENVNKIENYVAFLLDESNKRARENF